MAHPLLRATCLLGLVAAAAADCDDGECGGNDDKTFFVKIINYNASEEDCAPYTLEFKMDEI